MVGTNKKLTAHFFQQVLEDLELENERRALLQSISNSIAELLHQKQRVNLNFICTHNSRRSQFAQVWAHYAIHTLDIPNCYSFSGGTETTAFFRNTVKSLQDVGFNFQLKNFSHQNPTYKISFKGCKRPIIGFSKVFDDESNVKPFIAVTTCSHADENCPFIPDASQRFHLPFTDPKKYDGSDKWMEMYQDTSKRIAGELHYIFDQVKVSI